MPPVHTAVFVNHQHGLLEKGQSASARLIVVQQTADGVAEQEFDWKRTTTYTMLKRLCQRGIFQNNNGTVVVLISKEVFSGKQSEQFVEDTFGGSLPAFIAAFVKRRRISDAEADEIQRLIDESREENK